MIDGSTSASRRPPLRWRLSFAGWVLVAVICLCAIAWLALLFIIGLVNSWL